MTCIGLAAYGATGFGGAFLEGPTTVFLDRILLGGATALIWTGGTGLISQFYVGEHRLVMLARQGMAIELGGVVFLVAGGTLASLGWRWPFTLYLFAWLLLAMVLAFIPKVATASQTKTVHCAQSTGSMSTIFLAGGASMCAFFTAIVLLPEQLGRRGFTAAQTGYFLAGVSLVAVVTAAALPATLRRLSPGRTLAVAFLCYAAAHCVIAFADRTYWYFAAAVLLGCGFGLSIPLVNHLTVELSSSSSREINLSRLCMAVFAGQFAPSLLVITLNSPASASLGMAVLSALMATVMLGQRHLLKPQ
jgi:cyanate permease